MEFDYSRLKRRIKVRYRTQSNLAKALNISTRTLSLKLNNKIMFDQVEIKKIGDLLKIDVNTLHLYFFTPKFNNFNESREAKRY